MSSKGFTLIEALVAIVIGVAVVVGIGGLSERLLHHRTTTDSNSAAQSLAEWQMEQLFADANYNPPATDCPATSTTSNTCGTATVNPPAGSLCGAPAASGRQHGPFPYNAAGNSATNGPYCVQWNVVDASTSTTNSPLVIPTNAIGPAGGAAPTKRITIQVRHLKNPLVYAKVVTQYPSAPPKPTPTP